jgi:outer membrane protein OmpA-like peptidoglycan-associated protein/Flp pilus assembly protein TadD
MVRKRSSAFLSASTIGVIGFFTLLSACRPAGFINKVKYEGTKYVNTCSTLEAEVTNVIKQNQEPNRLRVSEDNHTAIDFYYLEEGQYMVNQDTLFFRLEDDLDHAHYLDDEVAIHVNASYRSPEALAALDQAPTGDLGTMVIDQAYYNANKGIYLLYKFPLNGQVIDGRQLLLSFAIAEYDDEGNVVQYFCETDTKPLGTMEPACCTAQPWAAVPLPTVVAMPELKVDQQTFVYQGFTGTIDVRFEPNSTSISDDSTFSTDLVQSYINDYQETGYGIERLKLTGYASPPGLASYNQKLSDKRAQSLREGLASLNLKLKAENIMAEGKGEDWERVRLLISTSDLPEEQRTTALAIANDTTLGDDQREYKLRSLANYAEMKETLLGPSRHTFAVMGFAYEGKMPTLEYYSEQLPVASSELEEIATTVFEVPPHSAASNPDSAFEVLEKVLTRTASPELYALRATYHLAREDYQLAFDDLEKASRFRGPDAEKYTLAIEGYKVLFADTYDFAQRKALYDAYTRMIAAAPSNRNLQVNQAILMEKMGLLANARSSYDQMLASSTPTAAQLNNRGVARLKANRLLAAEMDFKAAVEQDNSLAEPYFNLAAVFAYRGLPRDVIEYLDLAIARDAKYRDQILNNPVFSVVSEDRRFDKYRAEGE